MLRAAPLVEFMPQSPHVGRLAGLSARDRISGEAGITPEVFYCQTHPIEKSDPTVFIQLTECGEGLCFTLGTCGTGPLASIA